MSIEPLHHTAPLSVTKHSFQVNSVSFHGSIMDEKVATMENGAEITAGETANGEGDDMLLEMVLKQSLLETSRQEDSINANGRSSSITMDENSTWNSADDDAVMEYVLRESAREVQDVENENSDGTIPQHHDNPPSSTSPPTTSNTTSSSSIDESLPKEELSGRDKLERMIDTSSEEHLIESGRARLDRLMQAYPSLSVPEAGIESADSTVVLQPASPEPDLVELLEEGNADRNDLTSTAVPQDNSLQQPQSDPSTSASDDSEHDAQQPRQLMCPLTMRPMSVGYNRNGENDEQQPQLMCPLTMTPTAINYHQTFTIVPSSSRPPEAYRLRGSERKGGRNVVYSSSSCSSDSDSVSTGDEYEDCFGKFKMKDLDRVKVKIGGEGQSGLQRSHSNEGSNARPGAYNVAGDDNIPMVTMAPRPRPSGPGKKNVEEDADVLPVVTLAPHPPPSAVYNDSKSSDIPKLDEPVQAADDGSDSTFFIGWKNYTITMALAIIVLLVLIAILAAISVILF